MAHRFYYPGEYSIGKVAELDGAESAHALKVLRVPSGDEIGLLDGCGHRATAEILPPPDGRRARNVACRIVQVEEFPAPAVKVRLYFAHPKSHGMDLLLKTATELGACELSPITCRYGVCRPDEDTLSSWSQTLIGAMKQSANPWLPRFTPLQTLSEALAHRSSRVSFFGAVPAPGDSATPFEALSAVPESGEVSLWIGPEGGFTAEEEAELRQSGVIPLTIGKWILRVETAVSALLAVVQAAIASRKGPAR